MPANTHSTAESSDHQKPGAARAMKVVIRPMTPPSRISQPTSTAIASPATSGRATAAAPSRISTIPSIRNMRQ